MLPIKIPKGELYDSSTRKFIHINETTLRLEHSLISISKWESKWHKAFMGEEEFTDEEIIDYIRCMTITQNVQPELYYNLTPEVINEIIAYIRDPHTASSVPDTDDRKINGETVTSELIYYWMVALQIPWEAQTWHINRLIMLIRICNYKNEPPKKMSMSQIASQRKALNAARRAKYNSKG